ncbi:auxin efflux carrier component 5-like [Typha angustifolia]|uniref:auxin efflux carrier component 5-like n=1 Tax=Typha angustifolia TaxID=59011 RepID=UPI003C300B08
MAVWGVIYKGLVPMAPLYAPLGLGYGSVRWWKKFTPEQCDGISLFVVFFLLPFFAFDFTIHTNPFDMNYRVIAADALSKLITVLALAVWAKCTSKGSSRWFITSFSLATLTSPLVVGVPLANAMYGGWAQDLVVQLSVVQSVLWLPLLLIMYELMQAWSKGVDSDSDSESAESTASSEISTVSTGSWESWPSLGRTRSASSSSSSDSTAKGEDVVIDVGGIVVSRCLSSLESTKVVCLKLALNPNFYASIIGITWALVANRWHFEMPTIIEGSVSIMSKAGTAAAMFSMGQFMALQDKIITCGPRSTVIAMVLKFIVGPAFTAVCAAAVGLRGDVLRVVILQAALPQSITSFVLARDYGLHADVLSTAVIFGMLVSLPVLVAYFVILGFL